MSDGPNPAPPPDTALRVALSDLAQAVNDDLGDYLRPESTSDDFDAALAWAKGLDPAGRGLRTLRDRPQLRADESGARGTAGLRTARRSDPMNNPASTPELPHWQRDALTAGLPAARLDLHDNLLVALDGVTLCDADRETLIWLAQQAPGHVDTITSLLNRSADLGLADGVEAAYGSVAELRDRVRRAASAELPSRSPHGRADFRILDGGRSASEPDGISDLGRALSDAQIRRSTADFTTWTYETETQSVTPLRISRPGETSLRRVSRPTRASEGLKRSWAAVA